MAQDVQVDEANAGRVLALLEEKYRPQDHQEAQELILGALQDVQGLLGWVPLWATRLVAEHLGIAENRIYGLLTFYADFRTEKPGKHVMLLCHGTACFVGGSQKLITELRNQYGISNGETTADGEVTVQIVNGCLGVCDLAPVVQFDHHDYYGKLDVEKFNEAIADVIRRGPAESHNETH